MSITATLPRPLSGSPTTEATTNETHTSGPGPQPAELQRKAPALPGGLQQLGASTAGLKQPPVLRTGLELLKHAPTLQAAAEPGPLWKPPTSVQG